MVFDGFLMVFDGFLMVFDGFLFCEFRSDGFLIGFLGGCSRFPSPFCLRITRLLVVFGQFWKIWYLGMPPLPSKKVVLLCLLRSGF